MEEEADDDDRDLAEEHSSSETAIDDDGYEEFSKARVYVCFSRKPNPLWFSDNLEVRSMPWYANPTGVPEWGESLRLLN